MKEKIEELVKLGMTKEEATEFVSYIASGAYDAGYSAGMDDEPAIIGESTGVNGMDFFEWFDNELKQ
jgi:hypothetical protein